MANVSIVPGSMIGPPRVNLTSMTRPLRGASNSHLGDDGFVSTVTDALENKIKSSAASGATEAVQPYIMGGLAISAGAVLIAMTAFLMAKEALKLERAKHSVSGALRGAKRVTRRRH